MFRTRSISRRAPTPERGFSIIELIATVVIISVLAAVAITRTSNTYQERQRAVARRVVSELNFARELALATGRSTWVKVYPSNETIEYYQTALASSPLASTAVAITDPATHRSMSTLLNSASGEMNTSGVAIGSFAGSTSTTSWVGFDWRGRPTSDTNAVLTTDTSLTITAASGSVTFSDITITIAARTGAISITMP